MSVKITVQARFTTFLTFQMYGGQQTWICKLYRCTVIVIRVSVYYDKVLCLWHECNMMYYKKKTILFTMLDDEWGDT